MDEKNEQPIHAFGRLKAKLEEMGIDVGEAEAYHSIKVENVLPKDIGKRIFFEDGGIFYKDDKGVKRRGFMFKSKFYFEWEGDPCYPKYHVCQCETLQSWGKDAYSFANDEPVRMYDRSNKRYRDVTGLELCYNCSRMLQGAERYRAQSSSSFVDYLKEEGEVEEPQEQELDFFGYVKDWEQISLAFREKKDFTCEKCGIRIDDLFDRQYIHTHHIDGNKSNNKPSNLQCLCIQCHSEIDDAHRRNFSRGANKVSLDDFIKKYRRKH